MFYILISQKKNSHLSLNQKKRKRNLSPRNKNSQVSPELLSFTSIKQNPHEKNTKVLMEANAAELTE